MPVREIREDDSRGRHKTTHRQLIMLKSGMMVIDTRSDNTPAVSKKSRGKKKGADRFARTNNDASL